MATPPQENPAVKPLQSLGFYYLVAKICRLEIRADSGPFKVTLPPY